MTMTTTQPAAKRSHRLLILLAVAALLFASSSAASAAPNPDDAPSTIVPVEIPTVEIPDLSTAFELTVDAEIKVDCSVDPAIAHVTYINNSATLKTFRLTIFGSQDGTTEAVDIGPGIRHVHTVNGVDSAQIQVAHKNKTLAEVEVDCSLQLVPVGPDRPIFELAPTPTPTPVPTQPPAPTPTPLPTTTPLVPSVGTDAVVMQVTCGNQSQPNQVLVQLVNGTNGDRVFDLARSNGNTIEPRTVTLAAGEARVEAFDATNGIHVMQVFVDVIAILEEQVVVDCLVAPGPDIDPPTVPENPVPTPRLPVPEDATPEDSTTGAANSDSTPEASAHDAGAETSDDASLAAVPAQPVTDPADMATPAPTAPVATTTNGLSMPLIAIGAALVGCVGLAGVALGRRSS